AICGGLLLVFGQPVGEAAFLRDALALGTAAAMSAPRVMRYQARASQSHRLGRRLDQLDEIAGVVGLLFLASFFRPDAALFRWNLPGAVWLFVTIGLGVTVGLLIYVVFRRPSTGDEFLLMTLGSVAFTAGLAGYLWLSPIVVCFFAGALLANLPWANKRRLGATLKRLERPIYMVFLT